MRSFARFVLTSVLAATFATPAFAHDDDGCSVRELAGRWLFATQIGRQALGGPFPPDKDITALGTMNLSRSGGVEGKFDVTVEDTFFLPDLTYSGTIVVNDDCTGYLTFVTSTGSVRTDSIAVVSRREILAMSQDPANLWAYQARKIGGDSHRD